MSFEAFLKVFAAIGISTWAVQIVIHLSSTDAEKRRIGRRLVAALVFIIVLAIVGVILYYRGVSWVIKTWPTVLAAAVIVNYHGWLFYLMKVVARPHEEIYKRLSLINSRIDLLTNPYRPSIVSLPMNSPAGPRIQSGVTICNILQKLWTASSVEQQRSIADSYMNNFVRWECRLFSWEANNGHLLFSLMTGHDQHIATVFVSIPENEAAHIKALPPYSEILVDGRIYEMCILSKYLRIDNAKLTVKNHSSDSTTSAS